MAAPGHAGEFILRAPPPAAGPPSWGHVLDAQELPDITQKLPDMTQRLPDITQKLPDITQKLPDIIQKLPVLWFPGGYREV